MNLILPKRFGQDKPPVGSQIKWGHSLAQGLVGCWLFNEGAGGRVHDLSGRGNHGTLTNMAIPPTPNSGWNPGRTDIGLRFDGVNDYVHIGNLGTLSQGTIEIWINFRSVGGGGWGGVVQGVQTSGSTYYMFCYGNDRVTVFKNAYTTSILQNNQWYHITITWKPGESRVYVDGVVDNFDAISYTLDLTDLAIGIYHDGYYFNGFIDEVCIYNRALLPFEVCSLYEDPYQFITPQRSKGE